ncbi:MAG: toxin-antitoxin system YwqK family antitoxin [Bacteroidales bacterium]
MKILMIIIGLWAMAGLKGQEPAGQEQESASAAANRLDAEGRRTGPWRVEYPNGKVRYEATFKEGRPVGEMVRYYENGAVQARMDFDSIADRSYTRLYYENGKIAAEGWYVNREKDSVWTYYSEYDGTVRIREPYRQGKLHGVVRSYFPSGEISEEMAWEDHRKEGDWKQYYSDGALRLEGGHEDNKLSGPYSVYYPDSTLKVHGYYKTNQSEGLWEFYDQSGNLLYSIEYEHGRPVDEEQYQQMLQDSMLRFQAVQDSLQLLQESENPDPFRQQ